MNNLQTMFIVLFILKRNFNVNKISNYIGYKQQMLNLKK